MPGLMDFLNPSGGLGAQGGLTGRIQQFNAQNPGALVALGAGIMNRNPAAGFAAAAPMAAQGQRTNMTAQFLLTKGIVKTPEEAMAVANEPGLLNFVMKAPDEYSQRAEAAQRYGLDPASPEGKSFILSGDLAKPADAGAGMTDDIKEYQYALQSGSFKGSFADWQTKGAGGRVDEYTRKNRSLAGVVDPELTNLIGDGSTPGKFDALAGIGSQAGAIGSGLVKTLTGGNVDLSGYATSTEYQSAKSSLDTIVQSYLYSVSGQAAPAAEVDKITKSLLPVPGDPNVAEKKRRVKTMVDAVKKAAAGGVAPDGTGATIPPPGDGGVVDYQTYFGGQ